MKKLICIAIILLTFLSSKAQSSENDLTTKANRIHDKILTIDTHTDTPIDMYYHGFDISIKHDPLQGGSRLDLPRMKEGGLDAVFFAAWVAQGERTPEKNEDAKNTVTKIINTIRLEVEKNKDVAEIALTANDAYKLEKKGKRAIYIGMENGYPIGRNISLIKKFYKMGARYITLCHTSNNDICDSSTDSAEFNGLSNFGEKVVKEMNKLGMIIDVSHISDSAFYDVLRVSKAPVIASHSCARAVCDDPRNLNDDMLKALAEKGGVIQLCIFSNYIKKIEQDTKRIEALEALRVKYKNFEGLTDEQQKRSWEEWHEINKRYPERLATVSDAVDHIDHIVKVVGINHVGIGTDFDGGGRLADCTDVVGLRNITLELVNRGYSEQEIEKIWGGNFIRVFRQVETLAKTQN